MTKAAPFLWALIPLALAGIGFGYVATMPPAEVRLSGFATSLVGRTRAQRHNALLAARSLNGTIIPPNGVFSFNRAVHTWSQDRGYVRAPVSYDGELVPAFGGGVCQTSTTFYNTALLAGMTVLERHHHVFAPHYAAPGRDAAVAYPNIDLQFRNPYPFPLRVQADVSGQALRIALWGRKSPSATYTLTSHVLSVNAPEQLMRHVSARAGVPTVARYAGAAGFRVVTYRVVTEPGRPTRRERLSDDAYPAMPDIVSVTDDAP